MLFNPGNICMTPGAQDLAEQGLGLLVYVKRHLSGDWGDLCEEDKAENAFSLQHSYRLMSSYPTPLGKLWLITEADRSSTTILLPSEY